MPKLARLPGEWLEQWARETPHAVYLAARQAQCAWEEISYQQALDRVYRFASVGGRVYTVPLNRPIKRNVA